MKFSLPVIAIYYFPVKKANVYIAKPGEYTFIRVKPNMV